MFILPMLLLYNFFHSVEQIDQSLVCICLYLTYMWLTVLIKFSLTDILEKLSHRLQSLWCTGGQLITISSSGYSTLYYIPTWGNFGKQTFFKYLHVIIKFKFLEIRRDWESLYIYKFLLLFNIIFFFSRIELDIWHYS